MKDLLAHIQKLYGLDLAHFEKVTKGALSENHILTQGNTKYFLKKYRFDNKERIEEVHMAKKYFSDGGIPVILPLVSSEKLTYFAFDNRYYALFPFINEKQLERGILSESAITSLGEMLGKIHLLGKKATLPIKERFKPWDKDKTLAKISAIEIELAKLPFHSDFDKRALKSIETKKKLILSNSLKYEDLNLPSDHLIHGDYLDHNVFFDSSDNVSYVFDFEKTDYSPRTHELFRSLMYSFISDDISPKDIASAKLYLQSYSNIYPISKEELKNGLKIYYLKSIHGVWTESEHYLKNNTRADQFLANDSRRLDYLSNNFDSFEHKLTN